MTVQAIESISDYVCAWTSDVCCEPLAGALAGDDLTTKALAQRSVNAAAEILYGLSGRQFGLCELTIRPCRTECCDPCDMTGPRWTPALVGGQWTNVSCSSCKDVCSCSEVCELYLPGPVQGIIEVLVDGVIVPPTDYRIDNRDSLVRTNGDCWPTCQEMSLAPDQPGTWQITYLRGLPVPEAGKAAFAELACELYKACTNDTSCRLPKRVSSVSRDGVTMTFLDPMTFIRDGLTGLYLVDMWVSSVNPRGLPRRAAILSPDMVQPRKTTWP